MNSSDAVVGRFLAFLAEDVPDHPERLVALRQDLLERLAALTDQVEIDLNKGWLAKTRDVNASEGQTSLRRSVL